MKEVKLISQMTDREKKLLLGLGLVVILFLVINFIVLPQEERIKALAEEKVQYEEKLQEINRILHEEEQITAKFDEMTLEKENYSSLYFPSLDQSQIIYLLNDLIESENVLINDLSFSRPELEQIGDLEVMAMNVSIPYSGSYEGVLDVVDSIKKSPRRILVDNLSMERQESNSLNGNMNLKIYSLEGILENDRDVIFIDKSSIGTKISPFAEYDEYASYKAKEEAEAEAEVGDVTTGSMDESLIGPESDGEKDLMKRETVLGFEEDNIHFIPSQPLVRGLATRSTKSKIGKYSLRVEYDILAVEDQNRVYLDLSENSINLKYPPKAMGIWVYSYGYSPITIGLGFTGQMGEKEYLPFTEGIGWSGWKYLELAPPTDLSIYPLEVDKLYIDMPKNREDFGVILFDGLESIYERDGDSKDDTDYVFHIIKAGDTLERLSQRYYGTANKVSEIMKLNDLKPEDLLLEGKVLVLKKP